MVALVVTTADKRAILPWFRLPEDNTLLPACLLLIIGGVTMAIRRDVDLARVSVVEYERICVSLLDRRPSQPL